jgi:hypothetical protein
MPSAAETAEFIQCCFRSVWAIELMCHLMNDAGRTHAHAEMIDELRASDLIVRRSVESLSAAGILLADATGAARYAPVNDEVAELAQAARSLYRTSPNTVRRMIVSRAHPSLAAFANAFRLKDLDG